MAQIMKFKDVDEVLKSIPKIEKELMKNKVDKKVIDGFIKELKGKKTRVHSKFLEAINDDNKLKTFKAMSPKGDGGYSKALAEAYKRVDVTLDVKGRQAQLNINTDTVVAV